MPSFEQSLPFNALIEKVNYETIDYPKKKSLLKDMCFVIGKTINECNPLNLNFSPTNFSIQSSDSIILPISFLDEYKLVASSVYLSAIYYCNKIKDAYNNDKIESKTFTKVESVLNVTNDYDTNYHNLKRLVIGTSLSFVSSKLLSTFYVSANLEKEEIRKIEKDTIIKSYLKEVLNTYYLYHKKA